ncbi:MAG: hypothetical protein OEU90_02160 [Gammaproteobacteria bacterium]|nr:hypothetical protein [Gammaproteobacteria bacterium]MDH3804255.1 hypothetical protein [Gammaproteobacteria bacterium]
MRITQLWFLLGVTASISCLASCSSDSGGPGRNDVLTSPEKSWGTATLVEAQDVPANDAQVMLFDQGDALAVWQAGVASRGGRRIYVSRYTPGGAWTPPQIIDGISGDAFSPQLAASNRGDVVVVWTEVAADNSGQHIYANTYTDEVGWSNAQTLGAAGHQEFPQVAMNTDGTAIAVWQQMDNLGVKSIASNRFTPETGWEAGLAIDQADDLVSLPDVAIDAAGNGIATWLDRPPSGNNDLVSSRFTNGIGWNVAEAVESLDGAAYVYAVALDSIGNGLATWRHFDNAGHGLYSSRFEANTGWAEAVEIGLSDGVPGRSSLALAADGDAIVVWEQDNGSTTDIYATRRHSNGVWDDPQTIDHLDGIAGFPQVATDANGNAIAVWRQFDGETDSIFAAMYEPQEGWGPQLSLEFENGPSARWYEAHAPTIVMNPSGDALVVWTQFDGDHYSIYANSFN